MLDNRDYLHANELTIKMAFLSLLFEDHLFIIDSEPALVRGYGDLLMLIRPDMRQYKLLDILLEFKPRGIAAPNRRERFLTTALHQRMVGTPHL